MSDPETVQRIRDLVIPPAWRQVWICPWPNGHIQATGVDEAGRRQYIYHPRWRELKDREKFDRALDFGDTLHTARPAVTRLLRAGELGQPQAYAAAFRLMDTAALRIGSEEYAETNGSYGVTTLRVDQVTVDGDDVQLDFPGKSGQQWHNQLHDPDLAAVLSRMLESRPGDQPAIAYLDGDGQWSHLNGAGLNDFIRDRCGEEFTAKDFRTWQGTVAAAIALSRADRPTSKTARKKTIAAVMREVADQLGNTPAVARSSYVDPRVLDRFDHGETLEQGSYRAAERSLRDLIG